MAKTFQNLPRPREAAPARPTSERDFFDLSDEREPVNAPAAARKVLSNTDNIDNTSNISNTGNSKVTGISSEEAEKRQADAVLACPAPVPDPDSAGVRQTFVLSRGHLEHLRDYVHTRRVQGEYTYSQRQALQEALDLLFAGAAPAPPRPAQTRAQEQQRRQRIRQGQGRGASE